MDDDNYTPLHRAVEFEGWKWLNFYLSIKPDIHITITGKITVLHLAVLLTGPLGAQYIR